MLWSRKKIRPSSELPSPCISSDSWSMGHHVVDWSFSIIILPKALTDTSRGVLTIFQELLILMLPLKLLSMFEKHPSESHWNLPPIGFPQIRVCPVLYPGNIKKLHLKKTNTGREENLTEPTVTMETDSKLLRTLEKKQEKFANLHLQIMGQFLKVKLVMLVCSTRT